VAETGKRQAMFSQNICGFGQLTLKFKEGEGKKVKVNSGFLWF